MGGDILRPPAANFFGRKILSEEAFQLSDRIFSGKAADGETVFIAHIISEIGSRFFPIFQIQFFRIDKQTVHIENGALDFTFAHITSLSSSCTYPHIAEQNCSRRNRLPYRA